MKKYNMKINGEKYQAKLKKYKTDQVIVEVNGIDYEIELEKEHRRKTDLVRSEKTRPTINVVKAAPKPTSAGSSSITAPIPGLVLKILVNVGDNVSVGDPVLILEAMKMESEITATTTGKVSKIVVKEGSTVQEGEILLEVGA